MEGRYFEQRKGRVEIIPMIDIMLFLLVFFIMITRHLFMSWTTARKWG